eukprot:305406_1
MNHHTQLPTRRRPLYRPSPSRKRPKSTMITTIRKRFTHLSLYKIILLLSICIILFLFIPIYNYTSIHTPNPSHWPISNPLNNKNQWISFGGYTGIPYYYIKKGSLNSDIPSNKDIIRKLITITTFCDINLLYSVKQIAINYKTGPLSLSVYIDKDYNEHNKENINELNTLFSNTFNNINNTYDITIGLLYINKSNEFYQSKNFYPSTPLVFRFPMNALRNLGDYQIWTDWTFNIDVDFWYFSETLNSNIELFISEMNSIINNNNYGYKSIFIIPSFEVLTVNKPDIYGHLNKSELINLIENKNEILPFHWDKNAQICTNYNLWYKINKNFELNYFTFNCSLFYEPWYIINSNLSKKYEWDNKFIGRGYSKTSRVITLRHNCFNFIVMKDLFIIHAAHEIHVKFNQTLRNKWTGKNRQLLIK